jgi:mono/diheme cytochrome c family protein
MMDEKTKVRWDQMPVNRGDIVLLALVVVLIAILLGAQLFVIYTKEIASAPINQAPGEVSFASGESPVIADGDREQGEAIFQISCQPCHTVGGGQLVGPDLTGVVENRDIDWLIEWIKQPDVMLAEGDPLATQLLQEFNNIPMPNAGLTDDEVLAVIAYLGADETSPPQPGGETVVQIAEGDPEQGEGLFLGTLSLKNGGPPCLSCHSVSDGGYLGGGTLGPDLTNVHERYGDQGLIAALMTLPFPNMQGPFSDKPLTEDEIAHLVAYFIQTEEQETSQPSLVFVVLGLIGIIVLIIVSHLVWRRRLSGVRKPLVGR